MAFAFIPSLKEKPIKLAILAYMVGIQTVAMQSDPDGGFVRVEDILGAMVKKYRRQPIQELTELWRSDSLLERPHPENTRPPKNSLRIKPEVLEAWDDTIAIQIAECKAAGDWPRNDADQSAAKAEDQIGVRTSTIKPPPIIIADDDAPPPAASYGVDPKALGAAVLSQITDKPKAPPAPTTPPAPEETPKRGRGRPRKHPIPPGPGANPNPDDATDIERLTGKRAAKE